MKNLRTQAFPTKAIMVLINTHRGMALAIALLLAAGPLHAQDAPDQLGAEIQALEQKLAAAKTTSEQHGALVRLAQLRQLSGNIAGAAVNWLDAAAADPYDAAAPVAGAYCLAATGEWEKAFAVLRPLLVSGRGGPAILRAWFLDACLRAWAAGDASALEALADNQDFAALRPMIYYTLWQAHARNPRISGTGSAERWKSRLLLEYPQSPEARASTTENQKGSPVISAVQSPLWLLPPQGAGSTITGAKPAPQSTAPQPAPQPKTPPPAAPPGIVLQTGLFSREANAHVQLEALRKAGFPAEISRKTVNGVVYWIVTVPAGQDSRKTTADLKAAGFDSFQIR